MAPIYEYQGFRFLKLLELPTTEQERLRDWLQGQTSPVIPGLNTEDLIYLEDYERWRRETVTGNTRDWD